MAKISKAALKAARERKEAQLADSIVEEEFAAQEAQLAAKKEIKETISGWLEAPNADDPVYWRAPLGKAGMKQVRKALVKLALKATDEKGTDWNAVPHLETDAYDDIEGIQPSFFLALMQGDNQSVIDGLKLVQTLAGNNALVDQQGWRNGANIAWYRVANAALMIAGEPELLPALAAGWTPPEGEKDPSKWMKSLKDYAKAITAAA